MKPVPAIVETSLDSDKAHARAVYAQLRESEVQEAKLAKRAESARETTARVRLELGRALAKVRKGWPARGPRAKGWGEWLEAEGIEERTARDLMELAGYVEVSAPGEDGAETPVPTRAEIRAAKRAEAQEVQPSDPALRWDPDDVPADQQEEQHGTVEVITPGAALDLRLGRWEDVLADIGTVDAVICDPPYGAKTHEQEDGERYDGSDAAGMKPTYDAWTLADVERFVAHWSPRCRGWMVALTSDDLIPVWRAAYAAQGRFAFAPVPCVINGMSVRRWGDGPSSWAVYAMVARPRNLSKWGTLPGAYVGPREAGAKSGRGKPSWLMEAIISDYTRAGDLVVDPMAGYGSTLFAAAKLCRRAIGAELDEAARREAITRGHASRKAA